MRRTTRAGDTIPGRALAAMNERAEGTPTRIRYYGGRGQGSLAEVREYRDGVSAYIDGLRVRRHANLMEFLAAWHITEADLRDEE